MREVINITDKYGFLYHVHISCQPHLGLCTAYYDGVVIATVEYAKHREPMTDDDKEWEMYEEQLQDWIQTALTDITPKCEEYFNK